MSENSGAHEMHPTRWGDPAAAAPLPDSARGLIELAFGLDERPATEDPEVPRAEVDDSILDGLRGLLGVEHVLTDDATRRLRTRGKSTPDLLRARAGDLDDAPDAVVRPGGHDDVAAVLEHAVRHHLAVVPFGGGTCVTGGLAARREGYAGVLSLDLVRMKRLLDVDPVSMTATLEPGLRGPEAEALLAEHGLTLGHFPQSFEYASIGGFAATRSSGQSSAGYGRFDSMVVRLTAATPSGRLDLGVAPASAAGPDLRQLLLGSEGAFGVITSVTVRVRRLPERTVYHGWRWPSFAVGAAAMRTLAQSGLLPTVIRLSDEAETGINLARPDEIGSDSAAGCLMIVGHEGTPAAVEARRAAVAAVLPVLGGTDLGEEPGRSWVEGRFRAPYLRDSMLDVGVLVETLETATWWSNLEKLYTAVKTALETSLGEGTIVLCHISHVYAG
jgi:alkyldihydroxyacetonephosphate synthase